MNRVQLRWAIPENTTAEMDSGIAAAVGSAYVHGVAETFAAAYLLGASPARDVHGLRVMSVFQAPAFAATEIARR